MFVNHLRDTYALREFPKSPNDYSSFVEGVETPAIVTQESHEGETKIFHSCREREKGLLGLHP